MTSARAGLIPLVDVTDLRVEARVFVRDHDLVEGATYDLVEGATYDHFDHEWIPVSRPQRVHEAAARYAARGVALGMDDFMGGYLFTGDGRPWEHDPSKRHIYGTTDYLDYMVAWVQAACYAALGESTRQSIYGAPYLIDVDGDHVILRPGLRTSGGRSDAEALAMLYERGAWDLRAPRGLFVGQVASQLIAYRAFATKAIAALPPEHTATANRYLLSWCEPLCANAMDLANRFAHPPPR